MTDRGYVPFALIGVLVLLTSVALVASVQPTVSSEPDVDRQMERHTVEVQTTLREATMTASRHAAAEPVTTAADTPAGGVLRENRTFEDALKLRLYLQFREGLHQLEDTRDGLAMNATLPPTGTQAQLRAARDRVTLERAGPNGTMLRVRVEGVTLTATAGDDELANQTVAPELVVDTPILVVHDRVEEYERRLNSEGFETGLGQRLSTRLYPTAWARGWAQYSGAPIQSVIGNRHVSLYTNSAILDIQRDVFGHSDPLGREAHRAAVVDTGITDLLAGLDVAELSYLKEARAAGYLKHTPADSLENFEPDSDAPSPDDEQTIRLAEVADTELVNFVRGRHFLAPGNDSDSLFPGVESSLDLDFEQTINDTYSEDIRIEPTVTERNSTVTSSDASGENWTLLGTDQTTAYTPIEQNRSEPDPPTGHWNRHEYFTYRVVENETTTRRWQTPDGTQTTVESVETNYTVELSVLGRHTNGPAPARNVTTVYEPGGPLDGPNLADIPPAVDALVADRGGPSTLAVRAVRGTLNTSTAKRFGKYPDELDAVIFEDLDALRADLGEINVTTTRGKIATFQVNPPAELRERLNERRSDLLTIPDAYRSVAHRASVAAQIQYLNWLDRKLVTLATEHDNQKSDLDDHMDEPPDGQFDRLRAGLEDTDEPSPGAAVTMRVDSRPSYLTREAVDDSIVAAFPDGRVEHPLVVKNTNLIEPPYGDVADSLLSSLLGALSGPQRTSLHSAADALAAVEQAADNGTINTTVDPSYTGAWKPITVPPAKFDGNRIEYEYRRLKGRVTRGIVTTERKVASLLSEYDLGDDDSREAAVSAALSRWETASGRALALTNEAGADALKSTILSRWETELSEGDRRRLRLELGWILKKARASGDVRPAASVVDSADSYVQERIRAKTASEIKDGVERVVELAYKNKTGVALSNFPKGAPVAPPPLPWVATVNFWFVEARGEYPRFTVRTPHGSGDRPGGDLVYVRDNSTVRLDVTGDGQTERLGSTERITFNTSADIAVAVPPGPRGVGDVDGRQTETSPGWPRPGRPEEDDQSTIYPGGP
ncbi:DUF7286 family protein [Halovenus marina]|uniref:DUF7286 family protein n=1 Tax=Halovenus marina TaxID=3396621 RepID=UPI003F558F52